MRYSVHGQWRGYSAGGCQDYDTWHQNPQFRLRATGPDASLPIHVFITLTQVNEYILRFTCSWLAKVHSYHCINVVFIYRV